MIFILIFTHSSCVKRFVHDLFLKNANQSESRNNFFTSVKTVSSIQREPVFIASEFVYGRQSFRRGRFQVADYFLWFKRLSLNWTNWQFPVFTKMYYENQKTHVFEREIYKQGAGPQLY